MFQRQQHGPQTLRISSSFGSRGVPIAVQVSAEGAVDEFVAVLLTAQMEHLESISVKISNMTPFLFTNKQRATEALGKLEHIQKLELANCNFRDHRGDDEFQSLITSLPRLTILSLQSCSVHLPVFSSSPSVSGLTSLPVFEPFRGTISAYAIRGSICLSSYLTNLALLNLRHSRCGDEAVAAICESRTLTSLNSRSLMDCPHDASIDAMVSSPLIKNLTCLDITGNHISVAGLTSLFASAAKNDSPFSRLRHLNSNKNPGIHGDRLMTEVDRVFSSLSQAELPQREADLELTIGDRSSINAQQWKR